MSSPIIPGLGLCRDADTFESAVIFQTDTTALEEVNNGCNRLAAVAGARGYNLNQFSQRIMLCVDLGVEVFHNSLVTNETPPGLLLFKKESAIFSSVAGIGL